MMLLMLNLLSLIIVTLITELKISNKKALSLQWKPFMYVVEMNNKTVYMGICREITDYLAEMYNFTYVQKGFH